MTTGCEGFRYFLVEYKKRLPNNEDSKDFHEHIDFMIKYFEGRGSFYRRDWGEHVSYNDERYWRSPNTLELKEIKERSVKQEKLDRANDTEFAVVNSSVVLAMIGIFGAGITMASNNIDYRGLVFFLVIALQGALTILSELRMIPFSIWGWLYNKNSKSVK